ncbi:MAG: SDR family oxidoreductase [Candidatus Ancillula sp.]|jgi:3-oxoacyl-[acyl-carrier protein] reductase|nr:SDR family oxidoreductase [Candidatus Ancillula sp.]
MKRVFLFTGGTSELGKATILRLLQDKNGDDEYIVHGSSTSHKLKWLEDKIGNDKLHYIGADFSRRAGVDAFLAEFKRLELVPTHWIHLPAPSLEFTQFAKTSLISMDKNLQIGVYSAFSIAQVIIPQMKKVKRGKVVFVLSSCILSKTKYMASYSIAKHALLGLMQSLVAEYESSGININAVAPSMMQTQFINQIPELAISSIRESSRLNKLVDISDVADGISFLLSSKIMSGVVLPITL